MEIQFTAFEYHADENFHKADYRYQGSPENGWDIFRNEKLIESLGPGYVLVKSLYCGICSTDIARAKLPFPLPQITGHEVIATYHDKTVAIEINASHLARGIEKHNCFYCQQNMGEHCPDRLTLGIDRLPGGFSPYLLVPQNAICPLPDSFDPKLASVIEPFAAALHAVESMSINSGMRIAVVGPRRLGLLLLLALKLYRNTSNINFTIIAVTRHAELADNCIEFGADEVLLVNEIENKQFDLVYDTTGSVSGFQLSMEISNDIVHVKSTHGLSVFGFEKMTQFVIDELSLSVLHENNLDKLSFSLQGKCHILLDENISQSIILWLRDNFADICLTICDFENIPDAELKLKLPKDGFEKFDAVLLTSLVQLNRSIGFVRSKGEIFWCDNSSRQNGLWQSFFDKKLTVCSSRCGSFVKAIMLIDDNSALFSEKIKTYISGVFEIESLNEAFEQAKINPKNIKLIMAH